MCLGIDNNHKAGRKAKSIKEQEDDEVVMSIQDEGARRTVGTESSKVSCVDLCYFSCDSSRFPSCSS